MINHGIQDKPPVKETIVFPSTAWNAARELVFDPN